jgi:hypothetical protein
LDSHILASDMEFGRFLKTLPTNKEIKPLLTAKPLAI